MDSIPSFSVNKLVAVVATIAAVISLKLLLTALETDNFEGMWFSMVHTIIVAAGVVLALRTK